MKIFLTGDRSMLEGVAVLLAASSIAQLGMQFATEQDTVELGTGDNAGYEAGVRSVLDALGVSYQVVPTGIDPETGKPAWDTRHEVVNAAYEKVVFCHTDPLASSIGSSAMKILGDKVVIAGA